MTDGRVQWHPGFNEAFQIELGEELAKVRIEMEHLLGKKPMQIDTLVITKEKDTKIHKNIGRIFRRYNIIEYKSPDDYMSINDFYKVYGYACFFVSDTEKVGAIDPQELTITFVCSHYPRKMLEHIRKLRGITVEKYEEGIYYLLGDPFPIQLLVIRKLSKKDNYWLQILRNDLRSGGEIQELIERYEPVKNQPRYQALMNVIMQANRKEVEEERKMCEVLREIFAEDFKEFERLGMERGMKKGMEKGMERGMEKGIEKGMERFGKLTLFLLNSKQYDALEKVSIDKEYRDQLFTEYGL